MHRPEEHFFEVLRPLFSRMMFRRYSPLLFLQLPLEYGPLRFKHFLDPPYLVLELLYTGMQILSRMRGVNRRV